MTYRFKITRKQNKTVIGTGRFRTIAEMNKERQLSFFHEYTNGAYFGKEYFLIIEIWQDDT